MTPSLPEADGEGRAIMVVGFDWQGITLSVTYEPDWLGRGERGAVHATAHLTITAIAPERARLPVTETGYRSHFLAQGEVEAADGPEAYVREWLDFMAQSREWKRYEQESRQYTLF